MTLAQLSVSSRHLSSHRQFVNTQHVKWNEAKRNETWADGGIDLDSIPTSATV